MAGSGSNPNPDKVQPSASVSRSEDTRVGPRHVLIVEDNAADALLIRHAIAAANIDAQLRVLRDGEQAIRFFSEVDIIETIPCPDLVILDINLPKKQGSEVLHHMRKSGRCRNAPVIAISTSNSDRDRDTMLELGANGYFHKPSAYAEFMKLGDMIRNLLGESPDR